MVREIVDSSGIAIIDFGPFLDGSNKQEVADQILSSFKEIGFSKEFFAQPMDVKKLAPHPPSGTYHRGYSAPGQEKVVQHLYNPDTIAEQRVQAPDVKESFECGREGDEVMPNIWLPEGILPDFKEMCLEFFWLCHEIQLNILRALALGFGLPDEYFDKYHTAPDNQLRLLHYPRCISFFYGSPHSEKTPLRNEQIARGLEVEDPHVPGSFHRAPPVPGALMVNAGDFMMRWSNDTICSTIHRVRAPPQAHASDGTISARYSIPYFCCADFSTVIDCIPGTWDTERPKTYQPISAQEYIMKRMAAIY
ncbi:thymine dioxygenase [Mycena rosella]|uniref:Thymine dioxygenase n=1 Tax=Mycena rosella TaxID=1033263 RepID=A0AAD7CS53_MYCRO|nr:thymine dioxygenase [Mycena rosella]